MPCTADRAWVRFTDIVDMCCIAIELDMDIADQDQLSAVCSIHFRSVTKLLNVSWWGAHVGSSRGFPDGPDDPRLSSSSLDQGLCQS